MKKPPSKVAHDWPIFFSRTGLAAQPSQNQKSRTTKSPLMQDWEFKLGLQYNGESYSHFKWRISRKQSQQPKSQCPIFCIIRFIDSLYLEPVSGYYAIWQWELEGILPHFNPQSGRFGQFLFIIISAHKPSFKMFRKFDKYMPLLYLLKVNYLPFTWILKSYSKALRCTFFGELKTTCSSKSYYKVSGM